MTLRRLGIIGAGSIASELLTVLARTLPAPLEQVVILVRPDKSQAANALAQPGVGPLLVVTDINVLIQTKPDLVLECAGHSAVRDYGEAVLQAGIDMVAVSSGALADASLSDRLAEAAKTGHAQLTIPAGAVGAMDILAAIRHSDVAHVTYVSRKPPSAWAGTPAEQRLDLASLSQEVCFFEGSARKAALDYPKNANVAATIALSGIGFEKTQVRLIADPNVTANIHMLEVSSEAANFTARIEGRPSPGNPKTSLPTVYSLVRELMRRIDPIVV